MVRPEHFPSLVLDPDVVERWLRTVEPIAPSPEVWTRILRSLALDDELVN